MSILDRTSLEASPLADLHTIASELSLDGYRRLRRADLIAAILEKQGATDDAAPDGLDAAADEPDEDRVSPADTTDEVASDERVSAETADDEKTDDEKTDDDKAPAEDDGDERSGPRRRRGRRGGRGRGSARDQDAEDDSPPEEPAATKPSAAEPAAPKRAAKPAAAKRAAKPAEVEDEPEVVDRAVDAAEESPDDEPLVEGVVELLANGSGFVRVDPPEPSDDDVYISSAQVKRCELVSGDRVGGPKRAPRRSERFASLIRVETINGRPASELADSVRFDDLPAAFPSERLNIGSEDPTLKAIEWLTPFGKGSRVTIVGPPRSGKSEAVRRLAHALADREDLVLTVVLAGARPEEVSEWSAGPVVPAATAALAASEDVQNAAIEPMIDQARRLAARGADAVVLIDGIDECSPAIARKALAAARNIVDGGSLTVVATAAAPIGGETTVIALDVSLASVGRFPALDIIASGTMRPELLVGEEAAEAIARTRLEASEGE